MAGGREWNSCDLGLKKKQLPEVTGLSSQVEDGESINHLLVNYEILYFLIRIQGRFGLCLQCALIVSVRLCFKIVVFISEKEPQSTYMEVIHLLGCVRTLSPGIYCICSILKQESLWSFWFFFKKSVVRVWKTFFCNCRVFGGWTKSYDFLSFTCRAFDLWGMFSHFSWWTFDCSFAMLQNYLKRSTYF